MSDASGLTEALKAHLNSFEAAYAEYERHAFERGVHPKHNRCRYRNAEPDQVSDLLPFVFDDGVRVLQIEHKGACQGYTHVKCLFDGWYFVASTTYGSCPGCSEWEEPDAQAYEDMVCRVLLQAVQSATRQPLSLPATPDGGLHYFANTYVDQQLPSS